MPTAFTVGLTPRQVVSSPGLPAQLLQSGQFCGQRRSGEPGWLLLCSAQKQLLLRESAEAQRLRRGTEFLSVLWRRRSKATCLPSSCFSLVQEAALVRGFSSRGPSAHSRGGDVARLRFGCAAGCFAAAEKRGCLQSMQWDLRVVPSHRHFHPCAPSFSGRSSPTAAFASERCF